MPWLPIIALPNIDVRCSVESQFAAIVGQNDERVLQLCQEHPELSHFLGAFRDAFKRRHPASIVLLRDDAPETYRHGRAIAGFRDALALATIPYARSAVITVGRTMSDPLFANSFDFYPWMVDRDYRWMTAMTPALTGLDELQDFAGQTNPEISFHRLDHVDEPLLECLIERWERCFSTATPEWTDRALFRSLNMTMQAARTPFTKAGTFYDTGRLVALWVSSYEILVHTGGAALANRNQVLRVLLGLAVAPATPPHKTHSCPTVREWALDHIYRARNDYLHGNPVEDDRLVLPNTTADLSFYASLLYRLMLTEFLGLHFQMPPIPPDTPDITDIQVEAVLSARQYDRFQERIEDALFTMTGHSRRQRRAPPGMYNT